MLSHPDSSAGFAETAAPPLPRLTAAMPATATPIAPNNQAPSKSTVNEAELNELTWRVLDDIATEEEVARLQELIAKQQSAFKAYREALQLEQDLVRMFR